MIHGRNAVARRNAFVSISFIDLNRKMGRKTRGALCVEASLLGMVYVMCCIYVWSYFLSPCLALFSRYGDDFKRLIICPATEGPETGHFQYWD